MGFDLSDDEQNGVSIAVNTILKRVYNVGEFENWADRSNEWWSRERYQLEGRTPEQVLPSDPCRVVELALHALEQTGS